MSRMDEVSRWVEQNRGTVIGFLAELVKTPSINPWFSDYREDTTEKAVQERIARTLEGMGFQVDLWEVDSGQLRQFELHPKS